MNQIFSYLFYFGVLFFIKSLYQKLNKGGQFSLFLYICAFPYRNLIGQYIPQMDIVIDIFLFADFIIYIVKKKFVVEIYHFVFIAGFLAATVLFAISNDWLEFIITTPDTRFMIGMLVLCTFILSSTDSRKKYYELINIFFYNASIISILDIFTRPFLNNYYGISEYMKINRNLMSIYLFLGMLFGIYANWSETGISLKSKIFLVVIFIEIVLLRSSTVYIIMLFSLMMLVVLPKMNLIKKSILWGICGGLVIAIVFLIYLTLSETGESNQIVKTFLRLKKTEDIFRLMIWKDALEQFSKNILFGIGPNNFRDSVTMKNFSVHNDYFRLLAETGIIGFGCFFILSYKIFQRAIKVKEQRDRLYIFSGCMSVYIYILFHGYINYLPFYIMTVLPFVYTRVKNKSIT